MLFLVVCISERDFKKDIFNRKIQETIQQEEQMIIFDVEVEKKHIKCAEIFLWTFSLIYMLIKMLVQ